MNIITLAGSDGSFNQLRPEYEMFIGLQQAGHNVTIVIKPDSVYVPRLRELGIRLLHCYPEQKISLHDIRALRHELQRIDYDIIYATTSKTIPNAAFASLGTSAKLVTYRGTTGGAYWYDPTSYLTVLSPIAAGVVCVTESIRQKLLPAFRRRKTRLVTIFKGHDLAWYDQPPADLAEFGIGPNDFPVACVANARPHKGVRYLLEAAKRVSARADIHILLVGRGMDVEPYNTLIKDSGMEDRIHLTGFRDNAPELIAACQLLVLPSVREGLSRVVLEAMGYGVPPVVTDSGGPGEIVNDGEDGLVVPVADAAALATAILRLHANPELRASFSARCKDKIRREFSLQTSIRRYAEFFREISGAD